MHQTNQTILQTTPRVFYRQNESFIKNVWSTGPCEVASKPPIHPKFCPKLSGYHLLAKYKLNLAILMPTYVKEKKLVLVAWFVVAHGSANISETESFLLKEQQQKQQHAD